jgi:energy-converting hydrogenase Eha subunit G
MPSTTTGLRTSAAVAGSLQILVGIIQAIDPGDTIPTLRPVEHLVLGLYATCLLLLVPAYRGLAACAGGRRGATAAVAGMVLLAVSMTATNLHDQDHGWFAPVAGVANALWLLGTIAFAVSMHRAGRVPRWVAVGVVMTWIGGIPLSQLGGATLPGAYWVAIAVLVGARTLHRSPEQPADRVVV